MHFQADRALDGREPYTVLKEIWNARGAADIAKIEAQLTSMMGAVAAGPYIKNLDRALRKLDR